VETTFLVVAERLKKFQHQEKGLTQILQRKTGTTLKIKNKKIPNYFVIGDCIICGYFHGLKKWWQKELLFDNNPLAIKLSFYISFLEFDR
jgi:hypothetical protein